MNKLFSPKGFLQVGGVVLLLVGVLGYVGVIGPTAEKSIFGDFWYFDNAENLAHTVLGVVGLAASLVLSSGMQKMLVILLGLVALGVGVYNIMETELLGAMLQNPADMVLHLVVGAWALFSALKPSNNEGSPVMSSPQPSM